MSSGLILASPVVEARMGVSPLSRRSRGGLPTTGARGLAGVLGAFLGLSPPDVEGGESASRSDEGSSHGSKFGKRLKSRIMELTSVKSVRL